MLDKQESTISETVFEPFTFWTNKFHETLVRKFEFHIHLKKD